MSQHTSFQNGLRVPQKGGVAQAITFDSTLNAYLFFY